MATDELRSRAFTAVTRGLVETGRSPHYTDLASTLGVSADEAREAQHEAAEGSIACWFEPETDNVSSWAPFSNVQNQHRVSVDGDQRWYAQCGVEALAAARLFPGQEVTVETKCPQTATDIKVRIKDGEILEQEPAGAAVLVNQPFDRITNAFTEGEYSLAYAWNQMNIFRSEDDVRSWSRFDETQGQIMPVEAIVGMSAHPLFADRLQEDYYPRQGALLENLLAAMAAPPE